MYISFREKLTNKQCTDFSQHPVSWRGDFFTCRVLKGPWSYVVILVTRTGESAQISKHINASTYLYIYISIYIYIYIYLYIYISIVPSTPTFPPSLQEMPNSIPLGELTITRGPTAKQRFERLASKAPAFALVELQEKNLGMVSD